MIVRGNQVIVFDGVTHQIKNTISVNEPRALASVGHCLITVSEESRVVRFWDLNSKMEKPRAQWDLSVLGGKFKKARKIAVNPKDNRIYLRSTYLCTGCSETMSSVVMVEEVAGKLFQECQSE